MEDGSEEIPVDDNTLVSKAKPGDYVKYIPGNRTFTMKVNGMSVTENGEITNYTETEDGIATGYDTEQTYNTADYTGLWQVLYNDTEHGLQIISADDVTNGNIFYLGNGDSITGKGNETKMKTGYNNSINTLNAFCANYVNPSYAISGRCVGSNPTNPADATVEYETLPFEYKGSTASGCKKLDNNYLADYNAMKEISTIENPNGIHNIGKYYWLASRNVVFDGGYKYFYLRAVATEGNVENGNFFWRLDSNEGSLMCAIPRCVRPCITLKTDIKTNRGDGTSANPYELSME